MIKHDNYVFLEDGDLWIPKWVDRLEMRHVLSTSMEVRLSDMIIYYNGFATTIVGRVFRRVVLIEPKLELPEDTVGLKLLYEGGHLVGVLYTKLVSEDPVKYYIELRRFFDAYFRNLGAVFSFAGVIE